MRSRRAFTILEVLVALSLFALLATYLAGGYLNVMQAYKSVNELSMRTDRVKFARAYVLTEPDREIVEKGGTYDDGAVHVTWHAEITQSGMPDLFSVTFVCEMTGTTEKDSEKITETFSLLRPTWSKPEERGPAAEKVRQRIQEMVTNNLGLGAVR